MDIGHYRIVSELVRGGMAVVYVAEHRERGHEVALMLIKVAGKVDPSLLERFEAEAQTVAQLQHPNIIRMHEVGLEERYPYLVMDHIDGSSLHERIKQQGPLPLREAAEIARTLADALEHAHQREILHRAIKPVNVLIAADGTPMIANFGPAKDLLASEGVKRDGPCLGTPGFMTPEQARGELIDRRSDVYGVGGALYAMLTGNPPFEANTGPETVKLIRERRPIPPTQVRAEVDADLEAICLKCLEKEPESRYESALALGQDLGRYLADVPVLARPAGVGVRASEWLGRNRALAAALGLGASVVAAVALGAALG